MIPHNGSPERPGDAPGAEDSFPLSAPPVRRGRKKKGPGENRKKGKMFMDVVDQAFIHQIVTAVWRDVEACLASSSSIEAALARLRREEECFEGRGEFAPLWKKNWIEALGRIDPATPPDERLEILRQAVINSVEEEEALRAERGMPTILDESEGQNFITFAIERILHEGDGEIEEIEDDD